MAVATTIELDPDGRLLHVRRATQPDDVARLRREVAILERLDHPGTVQVVAVVPHAAGGIAVSTAYIGGGSLADRRPNSIGDAIGLLAAVADTVAHAHAAGVVHGGITADHVLLDGSGSPIVSGWGSFDPAEPSAPAPPDDVAALGRLVATITALGTGGRHPELEALASRAAAPHPSARPTAAALADALRLSIAEGAGPPRGRPIPARVAPPRSTSTRRASAHRRRTTRLALLAVLAGIVVGGSLGAFGRFRVDTDTASGLQVPGGAPLDGTPTSGPPESHAVPADPSTWEPLDPEHCVALTGPDGTRPGPTGRCEEPDIRRGVVTLGTSRWRVGKPTDLVVLGLWDCGDTPTPAVIRPDSGEVWVYPTWASAGEEIGSRPVGTVGDADDVVTLDADADGCHEIGILRHDGSGVVVDPRADDT